MTSYTNKKANGAFTCPRDAHVTVRSSIHSLDAGFNTSDLIIGFKNNEGQVWLKVLQLKSGY